MPNINNFNFISMHARKYTSEVSSQDPFIELHNKILQLRNNQFLVHERIYEEGTKIPIHFAFGHEAIAVAVGANVIGKDKLLLPHRNIHYHLALGGSVEDLVSEYRLEASSISGKKLGSMNLNFPSRGAIYTSNILGNNLPVAAGIALGYRIRDEHASVWCVTGDGAIEEGAFYESLVLSSSKNLGVIYIVENNRWSLASEIGDRRREIDLRLLAKSLDVDYERFSGNDVGNYAQKLRQIREQSLATSRTFIVEVDLTTLGGYFVSDGNSNRYVNYHAGRAQKSSISGGIIELNDKDPVWVSDQYLKASQITKSLK